MKKIFKIWTLAIISVSIFMSCQNDDELVITTPINELSASADSMENAAGKTTSTLNSATSSSAITKISFNESDVEPRFGKPNVTKYSFKVYELSGKFNISVKLYEKATGDITYMPMTRVGNYWVLSTKIKINGWYDWRYVYSVNKSNISDNAYKLCNTNNSFSSSKCSLSWPFGADGSNFMNREGWISGAESDGCGSGHKEDGHIFQGQFADDKYAEDWNKNCGTKDDNGAEVRSPLDGFVLNVGVDKSNNHHGGYGNYIDIKQIASDGQEYVFRIAHLKYAPPLEVGDYVRASVTKIGNIGMSGGTSTSYHGHCALYINMLNMMYQGIIYVFDAK
jgi:hypothetical protein